MGELVFVGEDEQENKVCCLYHGHFHGPIYTRALAGIADIFNISLKLIDMDEAVRCICTKLSLGERLFLKLHPKGMELYSNVIAEHLSEVLYIQENTKTRSVENGGG